MISLSGSLNNAELYNRSHSIMAEIDKNNFTPSQRTACLCIQHLQQQKDYVGMEGGEGRGHVTRGIVVFAPRINVRRSLEPVENMFLIDCRTLLLVHCSVLFAFFRLLQHLPFPSASLSLCSTMCSVCANLAAPQ